MQESLDLSLVRLCTADGHVVGAGFLVGERHILTCAHVVAGALGLADDTPEKPQAPVSLDFPRVAPRQLLTAHVVLWRPPRADGGDDIAGLELMDDPPYGAQAAPLTQVGDLWEHSFRAFGFPRGQDTGVWATGRLLGRQVTNWVQIEDVKEPGFAVEPGFSGTPVWDSQVEAVVGMVVAAEKRMNLKTAFAIPVDVLARSWPLLESLIHPFVFLCYARADSESVIALKTALQGQGISVWIDREGLQPGTLDWEEALRTAIRAAQAVLLIASPNARSSRYVRDELRIAEMYQRPVYPLWIAGTQWIDAVPLGWGGAQYLDVRESRYETAMSELVGRFSKASLTPSKAPEPDLAPRNPYKGLRAFSSDDAHDFFGRDTLINELATTLEEALASEEKNQQCARLLAVVGPSGSGKSSVVMAGLLPRLREGRLPGSEQWVYLDPIVPGTRPIEYLTLALSEHLPYNLKAIREDLEDDSARGLHLLATKLAKRQGTKVVLLVDQFEELFTQTSSEDERRHFLDLLVTATTEPHGPVIVLLTLRADFYDRPMRYLLLYHLMDTHQTPVLPMGIPELREVIEKPAALPDVRLTFEGNLVGDLLFEMQGQVGALPLLQFTLEQLFQRRSGRQLTLSAHREFGGVKGALTKQAEETYAALPSEEHRKLARALFVRLIDPGATEQDTTRRRAALSEFSLPDPTQTRLLREVIDAFIAARLLITNEVSGTSTIEVSHEALIREWTRLADWLVTNRNDILLQKAISENVAEWIRRGKPNDRLYRGTHLVEAQVWAERTIPSVDEVAFLQVGVAERERLQAVERAQQTRELDLQRHAARQLRYLFSMTAVTAVVLAVGLIVSLVLYAQLQVSLPPSVTNLNDHGPGSLREAIKNASPVSTISFAKNLKGTISLTSGELVINKNLIIAGPGSSLLSISGSEVSRVFTIHDGVTVAIFGVTITKGRTTDIGGGILNNGVLTLTDSMVSGCVSASAGGIHNNGALTITNSTISGNKADAQGGGGIGNGGTLTIIRSTLSHNTAVTAGGGIEDGYTLSLEDSTIAYNSTTSGSGGGIDVGGGGVANIFESTIYGNTAATSGGNIHTHAVPVKLHANIIAGGNARQGKDILGPAFSFDFGYNLIGTLDGTTLGDDGTIPINLTGSPNVGPLQDNGGPTQTIALLAGSSAIDFIPLNLCQSTTDQRGMPRPGNVPACDIGAYESSGLSTATAQVKANATAEAVANASPIAYPPYNQSPVLTDPLQDNSKGNNWEVDTSHGNCKFIHGAFDIKTDQREWCPAMATDFTNFIYEVQMKIVTGDGGGIAFRFDPKTGNQYYFAINQDGSYSIYATDIMLASGSSSAIHRGLNQTNLVAAVVHGPVIELYINLQRVAVASMVVGSRPPTHGQIGVIVTPSGHQTEVIFQNAKVWTLWLLRGWPRGV